jgi:uncharacterized protein
MDCSALGRIAVAVFLCAGASARGASFDCRKAATTVEKLVCSEPRLSALDEELAATWAAARKLPGDAAALKAAQKAWMQGRDACTDLDCIEQKYLVRIERLRLDARSELFARQAAPGTLLGRWTNTHEMAGFEDGETVSHGKVEDAVTVARGEGNELRLSAELSFFNGHTCTLEGDAEWVGGELRVPALDDGEACVLVVRVDGATMTLRDPGFGCKSNCGMRGGFEGYELKRPGR